jgi:hypothetical protein
MNILLAAAELSICKSLQVTPSTCTTLVLSDANLEFGRVSAAAPWSLCQNVALLFVIQTLPNKVVHQ